MKVCDTSLQQNKEDIIEYVDILSDKSNSIGSFYVLRWYLWKWIDLLDNFKEWLSYSIIFNYEYSVIIFLIMIGHERTVIDICNDNLTQSSLLDIS